MSASRRGFFLALFRLFLHHQLAIDGDAHGFLLGRDVDAIHGQGGILVGRGAQEMQAVTRALELHLVLEQAHFFDADAAEGVGALRRVADEDAVLVEFEGVVQVAAAEKEVLAYEKPAELVFADGRGLGCAWRSGCGLDVWRRRSGLRRRRGGCCSRGLAGGSGRGLLGLQLECGQRRQERHGGQEKPCGPSEGAETGGAELRARRCREEIRL